MLGVRVERRSLQGFARGFIVASWLVAFIGRAQVPGTQSAPTLAVYAYSEDPGAAAVAVKVGDVMTKHAAAKGWRASIEARIADSLRPLPRGAVATAPGARA